MYLCFLVALRGGAGGRWVMTDVRYTSLELAVVRETEQMKVRCGSSPPAAGWAETCKLLSLGGTGLTKGVHLGIGGWHVPLAIPKEDRVCFWRDGGGVFRADLVPTDVESKAAPFGLMLVSR